MSIEPKADIRPQVVIDTDEFRCIEETIVALGKDQTLFSRGSLLVHALRHDRPEDDEGVRRPMGSLTVCAVPEANLRERMTRYARFTKITKGAVVPIHPSDWLVKGIHQRYHWPGIRPLCGVSDSPILRSDGSIWQTPGYDERTGVLYEPANGTEFQPIDPEVTAEDVQAASNRLLAVVCDFPFESGAHRAAWLAGLLTALSRYAFDGPAPLFLVDANIRAAGKGMLCQAIGLIAIGRELPVSGYSHDASEMRKRITSIAIGGDSMILLDNLVGKFGNSAIDSALTCTVWKDRLLQFNKNVELPLNPTWFGTGNNVQCSGDIVRRILHIRLEVIEEHPEHRSDFKHPKLLEWILQNRNSLLRDALTILSAYIRAGKPDQGLRPLGSFEGWSALVRSAVVWAGLPDPCDTQDGLSESSDEDVQLLGRLLTAWRGVNGMGSISLQQMISRLYSEYRTTGPEADELRSVLEEIANSRPPQSRTIGNWLKGFRNRPIDGLYLTNPMGDSDTPGRDGHTSKAKRSKHGVLWKLAEKGVSADVGVCRNGIIHHDIHRVNSN